VTYYKRAATLAPDFSFAAANLAVAQYEAGDVNVRWISLGSASHKLIPWRCVAVQESLRELRALLRRYPGFDDARAALTAELWAQGLEGDAEANWERVEDVRYSDRVWLVQKRRWPPSVVNALENFLDLRSM